MDYFYKNFRFCPVCGTKYNQKETDGENLVFQCRKCQYRLYINMNPAVVAVIPNAFKKEELLLTTRNMNPGKGLLSIPGGFLKFGEAPDIAIRREMQEELGMEVKPKSILTVGITRYEYQGFVYLNTPIYYLMETIETLPEVLDKLENQKVDFYNVSKLLEHTGVLAFDADVRAIEKYIDIL